MELAAALSSADLRRRRTEQNPRFGTKGVLASRVGAVGRHSLLMVGERW